MSSSQKLLRRGACKCDCCRVYEVEVKRGGNNSGVFLGREQACESTAQCARPSALGMAAWMDALGNGAIDALLLTLLAAAVPVLVVPSGADDVVIGDANVGVARDGHVVPLETHCALLWHQEKRQQSYIFLVDQEG